MFARARRRLAGESGFSLMELVVVTAALVFVLAAALSIVEATQRTAPKDQERAHAIEETKTGLDRMATELRHAYGSLTVASSFEIQATVHQRGTSKRVAYKCDETGAVNPAYRRCLRWNVAPDGSRSNGEVVVDRLMNVPGGPVPVFTYTTNSKGDVSYVKVHVEVPAAGDLQDGHKHRVVLEDGIYMRNVDAGA